MRYLTSLAVITLLILPGTACGQADRDGQAGEFSLPPSDLVEQFGLQRGDAERVAAEANRFITEIGGPSAYRDVMTKVGARSNSESIAHAGELLMLRGAVRLGKTATDSLANLRRDLISRFGCKVALEGPPGGEWRLMAALDSAELASVFDFKIKTTNAVINEIGQVPEFDRNRLVVAYRAFHARLSPDAQRRFVRLLDTPMPSPDEECWFQRRLMELLPELPTEDSQIILWQIATSRY